MYCFSCCKDVIDKERERCYDSQHDLDYEYLFGPYRIKKLKPKKESTLSFKKKINMNSEVVY